MRKRIKKVIYILLILTMLLGKQAIYAGIEDKEKIDVNNIKQETVETTSNLDNAPKLNSRVALVYDRTSGKVLYEKNGDKQTPMASTTKIMTAIVVMENSNLKDTVTINAKAAGTGGSRLGLKKNDKITVEDLLYGLMLKSGNDAAVALAIYIGGSIEGFANIMNEKAAELGLVNTHFVVPHGLDSDGHYTTAYELAKITDYALKIEKIKEIVGRKQYTVIINGQARTISNTNELLGNLDGVYGVKTGFTNGAGRCLVTSCKRGELDIITVVIGADTKKYRTSDSVQLIEYVNKNYQIVDIKQIIEERFREWKKINQKRIVINKGVSDEILLKLESLPYNKMAIKNTQVDNIEVEINSIFYLEAPVFKESVIGTAKILIGEEIIDVLNIYSDEEIKKKDVGNYLIQFFRIYCEIKII